MSKNLKKVRELVLQKAGERTFQAQEKGRAKALVHEHAAYV